MTQPRYELQTVVERFLPRLSVRQGISRHQLKVLTAIQNCRTSVLGGHEEVCKDCGQIKYAYNSCRNRHCPKCQGIDLERWVMAREDDLLPVKYFHVIFTLPEQLNDLCMFRRKRNLPGNRSLSHAWVLIRPDVQVVVGKWSSSKFFPVSGHRRCRYGVYDNRNHQHNTQPYPFNKPEWTGDRMPYRNNISKSRKKSENYSLKLFPKRKKV